MHARTIQRHRKITPYDRRERAKIRGMIHALEDAAKRENFRISSKSAKVNAPKPGPARLDTNSPYLRSASADRKRVWITKASGKQLIIQSEPAITSKKRAGIRS